MLCNSAKVDTKGARTGATAESGRTSLLLPSDVSLCSNHRVSINSVLLSKSVACLMLLRTARSLTLNIGVLYSLISGIRHQMSYVACKLNLLAVDPGGCLVCSEKRQ